MKVIDLLNKRANSEETPNKFKFAGQIFTKSGSYYTDEEGDDLFDSIFTDYSNLNDEIEIIEDIEKGGRMIEKIRQFCEYPCSDKYECWSIKEDILVNKINEIIDRLNKLEKEGNK